ncbi:TetR family transcriptional regulator [Leptotrichia trevisanii]|uniref:TetR family transcriptional regulator n=1 Tax=Leptotrichia trevisanii TaxID=109328 RepID=A0A510K4Z8_9FUSO|nr:TetR/AcrR family transcriptional regulator [Leptotrichia trevisanii]BBM46287.1 TetR family transcriptional regulator [Leptotrichia trevisanii]BBM53532.1 TetR family transcriptional regulator [Leptotrichia trevisanii]
MERKKSVKSQKRKKIVDKAWELFAKNGYEETKVEDITKELGVSKGSFYTYFATKDELLYEILGKIKKEIIDTLETIDTNQVPEKILEDYANTKMNNAVKILNNMRLNNVEKYSIDPKLRDFFEELREKSIDFIKTNIVEKFNRKNGNKYKAQIISEFILISIEEFFYDEFVLKSFRNMKDDELINIKNTDKIENSLKEIIKFINNALK